MDWIDKKEDFANLLEEYVKDKTKEEELLEKVRELSEDPILKEKDLFSSIFKEIMDYLPELSDMELRQRAKMIHGYIE